MVTKKRFARPRTIARVNNPKNKQIFEELGIDSVVSGTEIVITPFRNDALVERFPGVADKTYHFILCDAVPGTLYRISTAVGKAAAPGAFEESMTYSAAHDEKQ